MPHAASSLRPSLRRRRAKLWRGALLLALAMAGAADASGLTGHNSDAPVNYAADHILLLDKEHRVMLSGNVDISQDTLRMRAARATVAYTNDGEIKIQRLDASGEVLVTRENESARGDVAVYDFNRRIITLVGNVVLRRGSDVLNGARMVLDLDSGAYSVDGRGSGGPMRGGKGRVSGSFSVPKKKAEGK